MTITVAMPAVLENTMLPSRAKVHLAVGAFSAEEVTLGQAAEMAGISQTELMGELSRRRISLHYGHEEFAEDLLSVAALNEQRGHGCNQ